MTEPVTLHVYVETGAKRAFAGAIDWPGWCRSGRDEGAALGSLIAYGPRYGRVLRGTRLGFHAPEPTRVRVVERLEGDATTDFGAPGGTPSSDGRPMDEADLERAGALLRACWRAFDSAAAAAEGVRLRKGPRGGGRDLDGIVRHVLDADRAYLSSVGRAPGKEASRDLASTRTMILDAMTASAHGEVPARGPRGGVRWSPRYFVRRVAWHVLDHTWEIEDRSS
jgi:hypothetical protein